MTPPANISRRRIVVTGMGAVSAAGVGAQALWAAARDGVSCIRPLKLARPYPGRIKIAAQVPDFDPAAHIEPEILPYCDPFTQFSIVAADEALAQAGFARKEAGGPRTAVVIGTGIGGAKTIDDTSYVEYAEGGRPDTLAVPRLIPSAAPTTLGMRYGAKGPTFALASACSSATQAIGEAFEMLRAGRADRAIAGGSEACVINGSIRAWEALRVLTPDLCRPFSTKRNGMTLGEGAAVFILETLESAVSRGATPLCELAGYGTTSDAFDPLRADVEGPARCMRLALESAGLEPGDVDYLNAHGTATYANDITESEAMRAVFGDRPPPVSSTKPIHGHALGASGGLELSVVINALREQIAPPTINFIEPDPKCQVDAIPNQARKMPIRVALSNSFAFGGINATLVVKAL
ncbi:beta-ketoacyl-[acyl-carrier-protein] synthase family protein [Methylocystis sp. WRRC1]|uniref:beta-ketoacyl-[acyl-carrier-protein] synthase family protein n=1 Tax=Methylocystis sp. WRRC1 TaxID=1732014 RepID=UPI001D1490E6|nr:beta-ketoacyl-[acyl-carrier-protein] synthase family protein [Methylocystis sp. WRRC1]MCC3245965.1 beta-ketoacyl-[acyl-carrier-protein] synthase family protein [Methylocystis sp. WRRC1]